MVRNKATVMMKVTDVIRDMELLMNTWKKRVMVAKNPSVTRRPLTQVMTTAKRRATALMILMLLLITAPRRATKV